MKHLFLLILIIAPMLISCSDNDDPEQGYTSFIFQQTALNNIAGFMAAYKEDDIFYKIADLGALAKGESSEEIIVEDETITEIYLFCVFDIANSTRMDKIYPLKKNRKNVFELLESDRGIGILDKSDPTQYPQ
jgi:hypothetical protein